LAEQLEVDGVGVVGRQQLATLTVWAQQFTVELLEFAGGLPLADSDFGPEGGLGLGQPVVEELDLFVELLDLAFQPIGGEVGFAAADPADGSSAQAVEVGVAAAAPAGGDQERVAAATDRTVQQALAVVMVLAFTDAASRSSGPAGPARPGTARG
jgi:hypothetical protein